MLRLVALSAALCGVVEARFLAAAGEIDCPCPEGFGPLKGKHPQAPCPEDVEDMRSACDAAKASLLGTLKNLAIGDCFCPYDTWKAGEAYGKAILQEDGAMQCPHEIQGGGSFDVVVSCGGQTTCACPRMTLKDEEAYAVFQATQEAEAKEAREQEHGAPPVQFFQPEKKFASSVPNTDKGPCPAPSTLEAPCELKQCELKLKNNVLQFGEENNEKNNEAAVEYRREMQAVLSISAEGQAYQKLMQARPKDAGADRDSWDGANAQQLQQLHFAIRQQEAQYEEDNPQKIHMQQIYMTGQACEEARTMITNAERAAADAAKKSPSAQNIDTAFQTALNAGFRSLPVEDFGDAADFTAWYEGEDGYYEAGELVLKAVDVGEQDGAASEAAVAQNAAWSSANMIESMARLWAMAKLGTLGETNPIRLFDGVVSTACGAHVPDAFWKELVGQQLKADSNKVAKENAKIDARNKEIAEQANAAPAPAPTASAAGPGEAAPARIPQTLLEHRQPPTEMTAKSPSIGVGQPENIKMVVWREVAHIVENSANPEKIARPKEGLMDKLLADLSQAMGSRLENPRKGFVLNKKQAEALAKHMVKVHERAKAMRGDPLEINLRRTSSGGVVTTGFMVILDGEDIVQFNKPFEGFLKDLLAEIQRRQDPDMDGIQQIDVGELVATLEHLTGDAPDEEEEAAMQALGLFIGQKSAEELSELFDVRPGNEGSM